MARYLSVSDLNAIAERVFRAYKKLPEVRGSPLIRVDPELLLKALLGLEIEFHHLSMNGVILGATSYGEVAMEIFDDDSDFFIFDGKTVLIEKDLLAEGQTGRRNFTIIHEGCHHILRMLFPKDYSEDVSGRLFRYRGLQAHKPREEWQVDTLTSFLLMPRELVIRDMGVAGLYAGIEILNAKWRKPEYEAFCEMCSLLGVSKQALSIRMKQLGLIGEDQLRRPNRILDIFMEDKEIV